MPALPSILQTRENSRHFLRNRLDRLARAALAYGSSAHNELPLHDGELYYLHECLLDVERENTYLRQVTEEIYRQEQGGSVDAQVAATEDRADD